MLVVVSPLVYNLYLFMEFVLLPSCTPTFPPRLYSSGFGQKSGVRGLWTHSTELLLALEILN